MLIAFTRASGRVHVDCACF